MQVTALEAMIGKAEDPVTGINHHVVNYFYDKSGKIVHKEVSRVIQTVFSATGAPGPNGDLQHAADSYQHLQHAK